MKGPFISQLASDTACTYVKSLTCSSLNNSLNNPICSLLGSDTSLIFDPECSFLGSETSTVLFSDYENDSNAVNSVEEEYNDISSDEHSDVSTNLYSENDGTGSIDFDNTSLTEDSDILGIRQETTQLSLKVYYTNADNLVNKMNELEIIVSNQDYDIVVVTEVFPKNIKATNIDKHEYLLQGFQCFTSTLSESSRGVIIFIKNSMPAEYCKLLQEDIFF